MSSQPPYTPPKFNETAFNCPGPECGAYSHHTWVHLDDFTIFAPGSNEVIYSKQLDLISRSKCRRCEFEMIWHAGEIIYPRVTQAPAANPDLSPNVRRAYDEAASITALSPRGAAALLRLSIEMLAGELVPDGGKTLDARIAELVAGGLPTWVQQALDVVRVTGNHAVHPGQIDLDDDDDAATALFGLVNAIAEHFITRPKGIEAQYAKLPQTVIDAIARRDGTADEAGEQTPAHNAAPASSGSGGT